MWVPGSLELLSGYVLPDEFWTKEQLKEWQMQQNESEKSGGEEAGHPF